MIQTGTVLQNRYRINKQIGQGGMGAVYVATDERFGSTVAIKETFFSDDKYGKAFEREARLLNNLRHPALPRVSDHFSDDNGQFLVMEYIAGEDLSEMLEKREGAFPLKDVLDWADQLLDALDFLHTQEMPVIHRDIKPQNLKLTPRGQIILLDFGLAKGNPTDAQNLTAAKSVFGFSRNYASLEQMQGTGTDPRSDLYSLGATLYHLLTGVPPTDALTRAMQVLNGDKDPLKSANEIHPQIPIGISEVLQRAMALNANFRPTSAVAMRAMLSESENFKIEDISSSPIKKPATGLLTQNTQVFESVPNSKETQAGVNPTGIQPLAVQSDVSSVEADSVVTKLESNRRNIQIPIQPKTETKVQKSENTETKSKGQGKAIAATAFGTLLLVGSALGGLYVFKPETFSGSVSNTNVQPSANNNSLLANSTNVGPDNINSNVASNSSAVSEPVTVKKVTTTEQPTEKTVAETSKTSSTTSPKDAPPTPDNPAPKTEAKVVITDGEGNKVLEDGTIKAKDGTIVTPDGKVMRNGVVIANPNVQIKRMPPPNVGMPPLTREQLERLTPEQRRKLKQVMDNQRRIMDEKRREIERYPPTPPSTTKTP